MKKILIISYFFHPSNLVGAERTNYWANNLHKHDIFPIILTRCWNEAQKDIVGRVKNNLSNSIKSNRNEIHYIKYKNQLRDLIINVIILRKFLTLFYKLRFYLNPNTINYYNIYLKADEILKKDLDIKIVIVSGRPFESFFFGYKLKKKHNHIKWIPDYRDQWNTYQGKGEKSIFRHFFKSIDQKLEKKWTSNSDFFISTSPEWTNRISSLIKKQGEVILNGYDGVINKLKPKSINNKLKIIYAGTLYQNQPIEEFLQIVSKINKTNSNFIELLFIGCETIKGQKKRLLRLKTNHTGKLEILDRVPKVKLNNYLLKADLFYLSKFEKVNGWYPVKLFDYARYQVPILLYPSDNDVMAKFINITNTGYSFTNSKDLELKIISIINQKKENKRVTTKINFNELKKFSREFQTKLLAKKLLRL